MVEERPQDRLEEDVADQLARSRKLLRVCLALNTVDDPDRLLRHIVETTCEVLRCEAASVLLAPDALGAEAPEPAAELVFRAAAGPVTDALLGTRVPVGRSLAGTVYREDRVLLAVDAARDTRRYHDSDHATGFQTRVVLGVPMRVDGQVVGVLQALNPLPEGREDVGRFDAPDAEMLFVVAAQAAVTLRHARHTAALGVLNERLEDLDRLKSNFIAITSHELRTPLTAVQGFADVLAEEVQPHLAGAVDSVQSAGRRMRRLVETLDVMNEVSGGASHPAMRVDLAAAVREACADHGRPVPVTLESGPLVVLGDAARLELAVRNVVENAVRFTPAYGEVSVTVTRRGDRAEIAVADTGRGLAAADLERVFEAYVQVACPDRRDHEGLGVGLTVARGIAVQHGGALVAESDGPGRGATFRLTIPLAEG